MCVCGGGGVVASVIVFEEGICLLYILT
jgi:hypothetical protein